MEKQADPTPDVISSMDCPVAPHLDGFKEDVSTRSEKPVEQYPSLRQDHL